MRTKLALLGAAALSFAFAAGTSANAAVHYHAAIHHQRHSIARSQQSSAPSVPAQASSSLSASGNNPAKQYKTREVPENAVREGTLMQNGNNPAKRYKTRELSQNAAKEGTLMQKGNNPAKRYKTTTGAGQ